MVWTRPCKLFLRVPLAGATDLLHQMLGVPPQSLHLLMVAVVHQVTSVVALHLVEVALDHQLPVAIEPLNLLPVHGVLALDHHQLLGH